MRHFCSAVVLGVHLNDLKVSSSKSRCKVLETEDRELL